MRSFHAIFLRHKGATPIPFFVVWREKARANAGAALAGGAVDRGEARRNEAGVAAAAALLVVSAAVVTAAVAGLIVSVHPSSR
jgi:hypothetical protein